MALQLCVALLNRVRGGDETWPPHFKTANATAYWRREFPEMFYALPCSLEAACGMFSANEQHGAVLQWCCDAKSGMAATSGIVRGVREGQSHAALLQHYEASLAVKVAAARDSPRRNKASRAVQADAAVSAASPPPEAPRPPKRAAPAASKRRSLKHTKPRHTGESDDECDE
jgi:hypothetical protein